MSDPQSDPQLLAERLQTVLTALERIPQRFAAISQPADFLSSERGIERMDAICMILIAVRWLPGDGAASLEKLSPPLVIQLWRWVVDIFGDDTMTIVR